MDKFFSVVIPLYNKREYIKRAIDSVLSQTYKQYEIIVVNDGSTDGSELEVLGYDNHPTIVLINQDNSGVSTARNNGALKAKHELVCFLDADDEWMPSFLEEISNLTISFPEEHIYSTRHEIIEKNGNIIYPKACGAEGFKGVVKDFIQCYMSSDGIINSSSVCVKKPLFMKLGGFPVGETQGEDVYLWLLYALHTDLVFSNEICSRYYRDAENRSDERMVSDELPFQFVYFYSLIKKAEFGRINNNINSNNLNKYLRKNALVHIAGLKANDDNAIAQSHTVMIFAHNKRTGLLCYMLLLTPNKLLKFFKDLRNTIRKTR